MHSDSALIMAELIYEFNLYFNLGSSLSLSISSALRVALPLAMRVKFVCCSISIGFDIIVAWKLATTTVTIKYHYEQQVRLATRSDSPNEQRTTWRIRDASRSDAIYNVEHRRCLLLCSYGNPLHAHGFLYAIMRCFC